MCFCPCLAKFDGQNKNIIGLILRFARPDARTRSALAMASANANTMSTFVQRTDATGNLFDAWLNNPELPRVVFQWHEANMGYIQSECVMLPKMDATEVMIYWKESNEYNWWEICAVATLDTASKTANITTIIFEFEDIFWGCETKVSTNWIKRFLSFNEDSIGVNPNEVIENMNRVLGTEWRLQFSKELDWPEKVTKHEMKYMRKVFESNNLVPCGRGKYNIQTAIYDPILE